MRLAKNDGNSSMGSFLSHYVKGWLLSTAFEDIDAVGLLLSGALSVFCVVYYLCSCICIGAMAFLLKCSVTAGVHCWYLVRLYGSSPPTSA